MLKLLKELCCLPGVSGDEGRVRQAIYDKVIPFADAVTVDPLGNLIVEKHGERPGGPHVMLSAHMDEVGLIISRITEEGYLHFQCVGGIDRRVLPGKRVTILPAGVPGVIGMKPVHLTEKGERERVPKLSEFYIDIGAMDREEAEQKVRPGDYAAFESDWVEFGNGFIKAKALDDRVGCAVLVSLLQGPLPMDCTFCFLVQEEVGTRGAFGAAFRVKPDIALVLEGTTAADLPTVPEEKQVCRPGGGPVVPFMDGGTIYDRKLFELLRSLARENGIPWQTKEFISGGTDARAVQRSRQGVRVAGISAAVRYLHTPSSVMAGADAVQMERLARLFLQALADGKGV